LVFLVENDFFQLKPLRSLNAEFSVVLDEVAHDLLLVDDAHHHSDAVMLSEDRQCSLNFAAFTIGSISLLWPLLALADDSKVAVLLEEKFSRWIIDFEP